MWDESGWRATPGFQPENGKRPAGINYSGAGWWGKEDMGVPTRPGDEVTGAVSVLVTADSQGALTAYPSLVTLSLTPGQGGVCQGPPIPGYSFC